MVGILKGSDTWAFQGVDRHRRSLRSSGTGASLLLLVRSTGKEIHNGADDNASGTSGLLEVARVLAKRRTELKRSVVFVAFGAEEEGLIGSKFYVNHPLFPLEKTVAMLNMDMIGRMKNSRLIIGGSGSSPLWKDLMHHTQRDSPI